ncbi:hypothetical protein LUZ60_017060 [Juncus effusus]|nr:hypothetical protein LUZ60_017060 [Juncus effusus]
MVAMGEKGGTTCGSLLQQLQVIWDEVGETDKERDRLLLQLEEECLEVYKRKVDQAAKSRASLLQSLADSRAQLVRLVSSLGEKSLPNIVIPDKSSGTIKEQLAAVAPTLDELCKKKEERVKDFKEVQLQIHTIKSEIAGERIAGAIVEVDEQDLSLNKLGEFQSQLKDLQKEKSDRLRKVHELVSLVHDLCAVLGMDFLNMINEVHSTLTDSCAVSIQSNKSISNETIAKLSKLVLNLKDDKKKRLQKLQELGHQLTDLWSLMDAPKEERDLFAHVTSVISANVDQVSNPGSLALNILQEAEVEVERLDQLKSTKMREIALKKQIELEEIYEKAHVKVDTTGVTDSILAVIDSGNFDPSQVLAEMESLVEKAKEEAMSRKEILDKVDRWVNACEEETWLDDYSQDQNRYNASRGAHLNLKRAEKARILVNKIPALMETLMAKTRAWEEERGMTFAYDGFPLLAKLNEYNLLRIEREEEKRRLRDQKKYQDQMAAASPMRPPSSKKAVGTRANGGATGVNTPNRRLSMHQNSASRTVSRDGRARPVAPLNYVAIQKDDVASHLSVNTP